MKCLHRKSFLKRRLNLVPGSERSGPWEGCGKQPPTTDRRRSQRSPAIVATRVPHKNVVVLELDLRITPVLFYLCACSSTVNSEWDALDIVNTLTL